MARCQRAANRRCKEPCDVQTYFFMNRPNISAAVNRGRQPRAAQHPVLSAPASRTDVAIADSSFCAWWNTVCANTVPGAATRHASRRWSSSTASAHPYTSTYTFTAASTMGIRARRRNGRGGGCDVSNSVWACCGRHCRSAGAGATRSLWAMLLAHIHEAFPLLCPRRVTSLPRTSTPPRSCSSASRSDRVRHRRRAPDARRSGHTALRCGA